MTDAPALPERSLAVYVHWPYCARICPYCDFTVVRDRGRTAEQARLAAAIVADLEVQRALTGPRYLTSIFFGGGTPSLMQPDEVAAVVDAARRLWTPAADLEIGLEANPTDAEAGRFSAFAAAGVERLSLGVQALDDAALKALGRNHGAEEARRAAALAAAIFPRLSIDLIYARPGQTPDAWRAELSEAVAWGAGHISPYQLTIEQGTPFDRAVGRGTLVPPGEDLAGDLFDATQAVLEAAGFDAYEVSNHARGDAHRSRHNLAYWTGVDYLGVGPGAHGRITPHGGSARSTGFAGPPPLKAGEEKGGDQSPPMRSGRGGAPRSGVTEGGLSTTRLATLAPARIADYIAAVEAGGPGFGVGERLSVVDIAEERLLLGLRIDAGVGFGELAALGLSPGDPRVVDLVEAGLLANDAIRLRATRRGRLVLDRLTASLA